MPATITVDGYEGLQDLYDGVADDFNAIDYTDWMVRELDELARLHAGYFQRETGPDGATWPANAPSTIKAKGHARILRGKPSNNFRLSRSLTAPGRQSTDDAVREAIQTDTGAYLTFGTAVEYSTFHDVPRFGKAARRHVGMNENHLDKMVGRVADYVIKQLAQ